MPELRYQKLYGYNWKQCTHGSPRTVHLEVEVTARYEPFVLHVWTTPGEALAL